MARWTLLRSTSNPCVAATYDDPTGSAPPRPSNWANFPDGFVLPPWDYNVAPTTHQPVIRNDKEAGERELVLMRWGLVPHFSRSLADFKGSSTINARADTLMSRAMWGQTEQR